MKSKIFFLSISFLITTTFYAQNFNDALRLSEPGILSNARSLGMGNSYTALSTDFTGSFANPAGMALANITSVTGGIFYNSFSNSSTFFGNTTNNTLNSNMLSQFGALISMPTFRGSLSFGLGYQRVKDFNSTVKFDGFNNGGNSMIQDLTLVNDNIPFDLRLSYPFYDGDGNYLYDETNVNGNLNQSGTINEEGNLNAWSFSAAVEIASDLFVGGTLNIYGGDFKREREYYEEDSKQFYEGDLDPTEPSSDFQLFYFNDVIDWEISGWDVKFGVLYQFDKNGKFGFTAKLPTQFTIGEKYIVDAESKFGDRLSYNRGTDVSEIEYDITTPFEISSGLSYNFKGFTFSGQVNVTDYSQMEFSDGLSSARRSQKNREIEELFRTVISYNVGIEYELPGPELMFRAGFMAKPSPFEGDPTSFDKKYITAGVGFRTSEVLGLDVAYAYGWWETFGDNYSFNVSRTFQEITTNSFLMNLTYYLN